MFDRTPFLGSCPLHRWGECPCESHLLALVRLWLGAFHAEKQGREGPDISAAKMEQPWRTAPESWSCFDQ